MDSTLNVETLVTIRAEQSVVTYEVTVDMPYLRKLAGEGYQKLKKNFAFNWVSKSINPQTFPLEGDDFFLNVAFKIFHCNRNVTSNEVLMAMDREGLRPATFAELLAFSLKFPELQRQFPLVALGSFALVYKNRRVPFLSGASNQRNLNVDYGDTEWFTYYRFLAICK